MDASVNPISYEHGIPVYIDTERDTWNMDPVALEKAFEMYPDVKLVVFAHFEGSVYALKKFWCFLVIIYEHEARALRQLLHRRILEEHAVQAHFLHPKAVFRG